MYKPASSQESSRWMVVESRHTVWRMTLYVSNGLLTVMKTNANEDIYGSL